jgi:hypothetical protein
VVAQAPENVLAHLGLGASELGSPRGRADHLRCVLVLTERRLDGERLPGPAPLPVSWVRKVARAALRRLEEGSL